MDLPQSILDAINAAVAAQKSQTQPPETIKQAYITQAEQLLAQGSTEGQVIAIFQTITAESN